MYFKQANLFDQLDTSLKQEVPTRWMSGANSFESVAKNLPKIKEVLQNASNQKLRNSICDDKFKIILEALIEILIPFRVATETLERQKQITCHLVAYFKASLLAHCDQEFEESLRIFK